MKFIKGLGLGIYYRLRRMNKALRNWRRFGVIIVGGIFLAVSVLPYTAAADDLRVEIYKNGQALSSLTINAGASSQFAARAFFGPAEVTSTTQFLWFLDGKYPSLQVGTISQAGLYTAGTKAGFYSGAIKLVGTFDGKSDLDTVSVTINQVVIPQKVLNSVAINPTSATLSAGNQKQFTATAYDQNGAAITSGVTFHWDIVNSQAGGITQTGLFTADNHPGTYSNVVKITATYSNVSKSAYASVTVQAVIVNKVLTRVELVPSSARLHFGEQKQFAATAYDQFGQALSRGVTWHWFINNASAGQITQTGLFTAGSVIGNYSNGVGVTATFSGVSKSDYAAIEVYEIYQDQILTSVGIDPSYTVLEPGHSRQFTATAYDQHGQVISASFSWAVESGGGSIDQNGWFTANYQAGTYTNTVRVTATRNGVSKSAYATVLINEVINQTLIERVEIIPSSLNLRINQQYDFNAQAYDSNNNPLYSGVTYTWSVISGPGYVDQNGLFAANSLTGNATVQVRAMQGGRDRYALATVYIYDEGDHDYSLSYVRITPSVAYLSVGSAVDFDAQAYDSNGQSVSATYTWDLMNSIGTLNQSGYFVAGSLTGTFNDAIRVRAYRGGVERIDYADVVISSSSQNNYGLNATLTATDESGGSTYEGDLVIYSLQLTNNHGNSLTNVNATFELPAYTTLISASSADGTPTIYSRTISWNAGTMYNGATKTLTVRVKVDSHIPSNAILRGKANIWASEINSFWVYANDLYVVGTGEIEDDGIPLTNTGALSWLIAGAASLIATILTKKFLLRSLL